jgi:hypothetical protein
MGSGSITYANFVYLLRDLDVVFDAVGGDDADILHYSTVEDRQYVAYRYRTYHQRYERKQEHDAEYRMHDATLACTACAYRT